MVEIKLEQAKIITSKEQASSIDLELLATRPEPNAVLMCPPDYYEIKDVKNNFMRDNIGAVDKTLARRQWEQLRAAFEKIGKKVYTIDPVPELEDMVFASNQALLGVDPKGVPCAILSQMRYLSRQKEIPYYRQWFEKQGYKILELTNLNLFFEGHGDAIWHPGKYLLWGGYGQRTTPKAYEEISAKLNVSVITLELSTPNFYHLDTCFCPINSATVLIHPDGLTSEGLILIRHFFPQVVEADEEETRNYFACNAVPIDGKYVIIDRRSIKTIQKLKTVGLIPVEVETSEFIKSGGGPFCLKMMIYDPSSLLNPAQ